MHLQLTLLEDATTPQGKLLTASHDIAQLMAQLSAFAATGDREAMIKASRNISTLVAQVITNANLIAGKQILLLFAAEVKSNMS